MSSPADRLILALEALREAALRGDLAALPALTDRVTAGVEALAPAAPSPASLARIKARAEEVAVLLDATGRGLAAARQRLAEIDRLRRTPATYGGDGQRHALSRDGAPLRRV